MYIFSYFSKEDLLLFKLNLLFEFSFKIWTQPISVILVFFSFFVMIMNPASSVLKLSYVSATAEAFQMRRKKVFKITRTSPVAPT